MKKIETPKRTFFLQQMFNPLNQFGGAIGMRSAIKKPLKRGNHAEILTEVYLHFYGMS